jgi:hypothetical protein
MFVIVNEQKYVAQNLWDIVIYLQTILHAPSSNDLLIIDMSLLYILQKLP